MFLLCIKHCGKTEKFKKDKANSAYENMLTHTHTHIHIHWSYNTMSSQYKELFDINKVVFDSECRYTKCFYKKYLDLMEFQKMRKILLCNRRMLRRNLE